MRQILQNLRHGQVRVITDDGTTGLQDNKTTDHGTMDHGTTDLDEKSH